MYLFTNELVSRSIKQLYLKLFSKLKYQKFWTNAKMNRVPVQQIQTGTIPANEKCGHPSYMPHQRM